MPRRVSLPGASELFRPTVSASGFDPVAGQDQSEAEAPLAVPGVAAVPEESAISGAQPVRKRAARKQTARPSAKKAAAPASATRQASGRVRHDEKITVYVSSEELLALEQARLTMRAEHGLAVDRGRVVRESIALVMADLAEHGADSALVRRLLED